VKTGDPPRSSSRLAYKRVSGRIYKADTCLRAGTEKESTVITFNTKSARRGGYLLEIPLKLKEVKKKVLWSAD